ncbi:DEAD/DEAH box helicase family protein, partial [bacterium]|nr:DEAD/DEAH box helicase family protein [bacterium]
FNQSTILAKVIGFWNLYKNDLNALSPVTLYLLAEQCELNDIYGGKGKLILKEIIEKRLPQHIKTQEDLKEYVKEKEDTDDVSSDGVQESDEETSKHSAEDLQKAQEEHNNRLPVTVNIKQTLDRIDRVFSTLGGRGSKVSDSDLYKYTLTEAVNNFWNACYEDAKKVLKRLKAYEGEKTSNHIRDEFLKEYKEADEFKPPKEYSHKLNGKITEPTLMQKHTVIKMRKCNNLLNLSGVGTGKTLSAILVSRDMKLKNTLVICPNQVVEGFSNEIKNAFPDSNIHKKDLSKIGGKHEYTYYVCNHEMFQQADSQKKVEDFLKKVNLDFMIVDEIHMNKHRYKNQKMSKRRNVVWKIAELARKKNKKFKILGMTATPIINNLNEGRSLLEMVLGKKFDDIGTTSTVQNCAAMHIQFSIYGLRHKKKHTASLNETYVEVACKTCAEKLLELGPKASLLEIEQVFIEAKLPAILKNIKGKTIVYTQFVGGQEKTLVKMIEDFLKKNGKNVGRFIGGDSSDVPDFKKGNLNVLIASQAMSVGYDGLQHVCNRMIYAGLPWTNAMFDQTNGRIWRQGQKKKKVDIVVLLGVVKYPKTDWSWDKMKLNNIKFKRTIADCVLDGDIPDETSLTEEKAAKGLDKLLKRLKNGGVLESEREVAQAPEFEDEKQVVKNRKKRLAAISKIHQIMHRQSSKKTHTYFLKNPEKWAEYHNLHEQSSDKSLKKLANHFNQFNQKRIIGDFGCGRARLRELIARKHDVKSFDHHAYTEEVVACNMIKVPLGAGVLDIAIFCKSLNWGDTEDWKNYLSEAFRVLRYSGVLYIIEAKKSKFEDTIDLEERLEELGFSGIIKKEDFTEKFFLLKVTKSDL